ncbi:N-acetylmuramate alpha-1-phosphate uridylyltransferase MurU [Paucibacter sp. Y2R2-4]|uniref:N-acetylmuramate alpha-1-phosphate uridylyltransferase MurU n=1 Tax=Paucibacter sp. Y2R2-4 TaxID=2893553 RepID=UPI0021E47B98|nr:nucleotidyltransferase family protein [Paucibacter sp. Y2R2-4]MCV2351276.1 nucleotidyltransferase family protein [Paucibacter sp. Y2R2-4]
MRAIILAAGRGERMRPLTDLTPKPLLCVRGKPLIEFHIEALAAAGVRDIVINTAWLSEQFPVVLGEGSRFGVRLHYSDESAEPVGALETAGGIARALPLLCPQATDETFWVVAGDVFLPDFGFAPAEAERFSQSDLDAHLWLTHNSPHHPRGDFGISAEGLALSEVAPDVPRYTWASVGLFRRRMFEAIPAGSKAALRPYLEAAIQERKLGASLLPGRWVDVGTPERLASLQD